VQEQRPVRREDSFEARDAVWHPAVVPPFPRPPTPADRYAVVDDLDEDVLVLRVASWPRLDRAGRLKFDRPGEEHPVSRAKLQERVDERRTAEGAPAPDRPLRIGDTFWLAGEGSVKDALAKGRLKDVTAPAREAAKAAFHGAVGGTVGTRYVERVQLAKPPRSRDDLRRVARARPDAARPAL
jgi:hypothetical protein